MLHTTPPPLPAWKGIPFLLLGLLIAVFSPKIVAFQLKSQNFLNSKVMGTIDYSQSPLLRAVGSSWYKRWVLGCYWFATLLLAAILLTLGGAILLGQMVPGP